MAEGPPRPASGPSRMMRWLVGLIAEGPEDPIMQTPTWPQRRSLTAGERAAWDALKTPGGIEMQLEPPPGFGFTTGPHLVLECEIGPERAGSSILIRFDGLHIGELVRLDTPTQRLQTIVTQVEDGHALLREIGRRPL